MPRFFLFFYAKKVDNLQKMLFILQPVDIILPVFNYIKGIQQMKKYYILGGVIAVVIAVAACALICRHCCRTAIVNIDQVVAASSDVAELRAQRQNAISEMQKFADEANADIDKQTDSKKKEELRKKYSDELVAKQQQEQMEYAKRLQEIDEQITSLIKEIAKKEGYSLVLNKAVVVTGGTDITETILRRLNETK